MNLYLRKPLFYTRKLTQNYKEIENIDENEEISLCFELNPSQSQSIEPIQEQLLGNLKFIGRKTPHEENTKQNEEQVTLPLGNYLFVQQRSAQMLKQAQWLDLAIEQQKDGLWERNKLGNLLYVRFLVEDGKVVTQVLREIQE